MIALDASASITSDSLTAPTAPCITRTRTSVVGDFLQRLANCLYRTHDIRFDNNRQFLHFALGNLAEQIIQRDLLIGFEDLFFLLMSALLHQFAGQALIFYRVERIASGGNFCQAGNLYWHRGAGLLYLTAKIVPHDPNMAQSGARQ